MDSHFLIQIIIGLLVAGVLCFCVQRLASLFPPPIPMIIQVVIVLVFCVWLLDAFSGGSFHTGRIGCG
jgi:hypothetical protein